MTSEPGWAESLRTCFSPADSVIPAEPAQIAANPALAAACDACFVAEETISPATVETLKQISAVTEIPLFVLTDANKTQWEEAALFAGAQQVFRRPLRSGVVQLAISRSPRRGPEPMPALPAPVRPPPEAETTPALGLWRDFSRLLIHAGGAGLLDGYVRTLREVLRCSRLVLYIRDAAGTERLFRCRAAAGTDARQFDGFILSQRTGVAQLAVERGTVIWRHRLRADSHRDLVAGRELQVFGADLAVPVVDREGVVGLLLVGPRITGADYSEEEVALLYQAAEGFAPLLTPKPEPAALELTPHDSLVLQGLPIAAALVTSTMRVLEVNAAFRSLLGRTEACALTFEDLPTNWSAPITAAVQNQAGAARVELEHRLLGGPRRLRLSIRRLGDAATPGVPFLITVEDAVPAAVAQLEADAHGIQNLLQRAGEQLSNEFRNALTPVDIMVQLSRDTSTSRAELERLGAQVSTAIHRLRRRIDDLAYLTKSAIIPEPTSVAEVMRLTRERLDDWLEPKQLKRIVWLNEFSETTLMADSRALALAVAELVMNAIEAAEGKPVTVTVEEAGEVVSFRIRNSGTWSPPAESSGFRHRPFVSSKSTGVGLGVEVASRVAENHNGRLVLGPVSADAVEAILRIPRSVGAGESPDPRPLSAEGR